MKMVINIQVPKSVLNSSGKKMSLLLKGVVEGLQKTTNSTNETNINFYVRN